MSSNQSLQNELNGAGSGNDSPSTVEEWKKAFEAKDQELSEAKKEIAELKRKYKELDDEFLERLKKGVKETNFNYGNKIIDLETKNMKLEIIANKYEKLKKEVADEKDQALASKPGNKDQEKLVFVLQKLVHQLEAKNEELEFYAAIRDEEERMEQELIDSNQETDQAATSSSKSRKRSICKNVKKEGKNPRA
ncbi:hypothetical protein B9Z55_007317 [Caenorhabditis nigoni]|nr:hypothetical protein B9Z55_007317 [Caenorhabditis nigoni]